MIKDGIEFKECDKCGKLCAKLEMVNWKTCKECVISELEAKNAELMQKVEGYDQDRDRLIAMGFPHFRNCKEYAEKFRELEKENAELKDQLTKAKELIERLLITSCNSDVLNLLPNCSEVLRVRVEAEQFLKGE